MRRTIENKTDYFKAVSTGIATSEEGGSGSRVQLVPVREQNIQGGPLRALYSTMKPGESFIVVLVPKAVQPNLNK